MAKILIVDDSSIARRNLATILSDAGHVIVAEAPNGELAFKEYERHTPDIVTMDITMPLLDGIGAVKKILKHYPNATIVMISALDQKQMVLSAIQCGAKHYIIKPFTADKVLSVIDEVLLYSESSSPASSINNKLNEAISDINHAIDDIDKTIDKLGGSSCLPFAVENKGDELHIVLGKGIKADNFTSLEMILQGFLFTNSLVVHLDLQDIESISEDVISKIADLARMLETQGAKIKLSAQKEGVLQLIKTKSKYLSTIINK